MTPELLPCLVLTFCSDQQDGCCTTQSGWAGVVGRYGLGFQFTTTDKGDVADGSGTEFNTNDSPSGDTAYCCRFVLGAAVPTLVGNKACGVPNSTGESVRVARIGTDMSLSSAAM